MLADIVFLHAINYVSTFFNFPAATGTTGSSFVKHHGLLVYMYDYVFVGHVACVSV